MRVLQVNKFLYRRGGAEGYMLDVSELLRGAGHEVGFFGMQHPENVIHDFDDDYPTEVDFDNPAGITAKARAGGRMLWSLAAQRGMANVIKKFRPDVAHLHNVYHQLSPSILTPLKRAGVPIVMTAHDYKLVCPTYQLLANGEICDACVPRHFHQALRVKCRDGSLATSAMMALELSVHTATQRYSPISRFLCPSQYLADTLQRGKVFPDRLHVLRNFTFPASERDDERAVEQGHFVFAGRLVPEKGVEVAVRAIGHTQQDVRLHILGEGPQQLHLETLANEVAPGKITFHGRVSREEVVQRLRASTAALVPSSWLENQPLAVLEAFGSGVPVIATDLGGLSEIVQPRRTGILVPPKDPFALAQAMDELTADPEMAMQMGINAAQYVRAAHDPDSHLIDLVGHYRAAGAVG